MGVRSRRRLPASAAVHGEFLKRMVASERRIRGQAGTCGCLRRRPQNLPGLVVLC